MQTLRNLLQSLSNEEYLLLDTILEKGDVKSKKLELRDLLIQKNRLNDNEIAHILYKSKPNSALSQLKRRLKQDILDIIVQSSYVITSECAYSQAKVNCLKSLMLSQQLMARALYDEAERHLKIALKIIQERQLIFEKSFYNHLNLELKAIYPDSRLNEPDYKADSIDLNSVYEAKLEYLLAKDRQNYDQSNVDENTEAITNKANSKGICNTHSFTIENSYYESFNQVLSDFSNKSFAKALIDAKMLIVFCSTQSEFLSEEKQIESKLLLARSYILNKDYAKAISICTTVDINEHTSSSIYWEHIEIQWIAHFLTENLAVCQEMINKLNSPIHEGNIQQHHKIFFFFRICLFFKQNKHKELLSQLSKNNKFINNRCPMYLASRLFEIYSLINLQRFSLVSFKILAFKQLLKRHESNNMPRYQYILKLLQKLERSDFDFRYVKDLIKTKKIASIDDAQTYDQDLFGYELISIEMWISDKCTVNHLTLK